MHIVLANTSEREISLEVQRFHEQDARRADEELAGSLDLPDSQKKTETLPSRWGTLATNHFSALHEDLTYHVLTMCSAMSTRTFSASLSPSRKRNKSKFQLI